MPILYLKILSAPILIISILTIISVYFSPKLLFGDFAGIMVLLTSIYTLIISPIWIFTNIQIPVLSFILFLIIGFEFLSNIYKFVIYGRSCQNAVFGILVFGYMLFVSGMWAF